jgi:hypothetical protein
VTWFKVDDSFESHPKVKAIPRGAARLRAVGLWTLAGDWCARNLTDGLLPKEMVAELGGSKPDADQLQRVGLWEDKGADWQFHDWSDYQPTRAKKDAEREAKRRAGSQGGKASGRSRREASSKQDASRLVAKQTNPRTRPVPVPSASDEAEASGGADEPLAASAQQLIGEWLEHCTERPPASVIGQTAKHVKAMLHEGIRTERIREGLAEWSRKGLHPAALPSVVHETQQRKAPPVGHRRLPYAHELELPPDGLSPAEYAAWEREQRERRKRA